MWVEKNLPDATLAYAPGIGLSEAAVAHAQSLRKVEQTIDHTAEPITRAALALARRFQNGGRLFCIGGHRAAFDAQHITVEFLHPVTVGKRALPAVELVADAQAATRLRLLAHPRDALLAVDRDGPDPNVASTMEAARRIGLLTIVLGDTTSHFDCDLPIRISTANTLVAREFQVTLYHVLWELVHVFREHVAERRP